MIHAKNTKGFLVGAAILLVLAASVLVAQELKIFRHAPHLKEGADCDTCHQIQGAFAMPALKKDACVDCHDKGVPPWNARTKRKPLKAAFSHTKHAKGTTCLDCHQAVAEDRAMGGQPVLQQTACNSCHEQKGLILSERQCNRCHGSNQMRVRPTDHTVAWRQSHGANAEWRNSSEHGRDCSACHQPQQCKACHLQQSPKSHNALWRVRTHGVSAQFDRESCKTCHETGTCVRCHQSTPPQNHRGSWSSTHGLAAESVGNEHCGVCHGASWCARCHQGR